MKIIVDTNVYISALVFDKKVQDILEIILEQHHVIASPFIIEELKEKLSLKFYLSDNDIKNLITKLLDVITIIIPEGELPHDSKDPDDNNILLLAEFAGADLIISGDKDLYSLKQFRNIRIIRPAEFVA